MKKKHDLKNRQIDPEADICRELPGIDGNNVNINVAFRNRPLSKLGADFVDMKKTSGGYDIVVADVAGYDMESSRPAIFLKAFFEENCRKGNDGRTFFQLLNRHLVENDNHKCVATALFLHLDLERMICESCSAAHPPLVRLLKHFPVPRPLPSGRGSILGIDEEVEFDSRIFSIAPGDRLFIHTDGVVNAPRFKTEALKPQKLTCTGLDDLFQKHAEKPIDSMVDAVWNDILEFCDHKPCDDMLLLGIEIPYVEESGGDVFDNGR